MSTADDRREQARGNGVRQAGQFGHQQHSPPAAFDADTSSTRTGDVDSPDGEYWTDQNGTLHRDPAEGPAFEWSGGVAKGGGEEYVVHGRLHRDPSAGPAFQWDGGIAEGGGEQYFVDGVPHRDPADGPAYQWEGGVAKGGGEEYWVHGERVPAPSASDHTDEPAGEAS